MSRLPIRLDPFFDSDGRGGVHEAANRVPQIPATPATHNAYYDASNIHIADGRSALSVMRPGPEGLRGTVIPRASLGGVPVGTRPHAISNLRVTIDPHIDGQSSVVRLGDITEASVAAATLDAQETTPDPYDMATQRLRGSAVLHGVAARNRTQEQAPAQPGFEGAVPPGNVAAHNLEHYAQPVQTARRMASPLQAFNSPQPHISEDGRPLRSIDMRTTVAAERAVAVAPDKEVTFELQHFGTHTAFYHAVLTTNPGFIVLVYNNAYQGGSKYFPQSRGEDAPAMALQVIGDSKVYLVHTTGFQYTYGGLEFCVLMVERQVEAPPEEQGTAE